ncbi:MAG: VWA domain-containing protein [Thermoanaerobaculia bacterium]
MTTSAIARFAILFCFVSFWATAQVEPPRTTEQIAVRLVELPVHVVDRSGNSLRGLEVQNFEILEDGKSRPVTHFERIDLAALNQSLSAGPLHPAARRSFVLLFDMSNSSPHSLLRAREAAADFVDSGLRPRDIVSVATFSVERGFRMLTGFTRDRALLRGAIDTLGDPQFFRTSDPLMLAAASLAGGVGTAQGPGRDAEIDAAVLEHVQSMAQELQRSDDAYRRNRVDQQIRNFGHVARLLDAVPGRKQIILLSDGFEASLLQGRENISSAESQADAAASLSGEVWKIDNDRRFGSSAAVGSLKQMAELFRRSDVVLHAIDIKGLRGNVDAREGLRGSSNESLFLIANPTGGEVFKNSNDVSRSFDDMLRQQEVIYILGFTPRTPGSSGKFHEVKVRLRDVPGGRVIHKPGYYDPADDPSGLEAALTAASILVNDVEQDGVQFQGLAVPFATEGTEAIVPVVIEVDGKSLLRGIAGDSLDGELFVYAFAGDGSVADHLYQRVAFDLTKVRDSLSASGVKFYGSLSLPPGEYAIRILVWTGGVERSGSQRIDLRVPEFSAIALLPPFAIEKNGKWVMLKAVPRSPAEADYPFTIGETSFVPWADPAFRNDGDHEVALFTYNVDPEGMQLWSRVEAEDGSPHPAKIQLLGRSAATGDRDLVKLLVSFKPEGLDSGNYMLNFTIRDPSSGESASESLRFRIE